MLFGEENTAFRVLKVSETVVVSLYFLTFGKKSHNLKFTDYEKTLFIPSLSRNHVVFRLSVIRQLVCTSVCS